MWTKSRRRNCQFITESLIYAAKRSFAIADCIPAFLKRPRLTIGESVITGDKGILYYALFFDFFD